MAKPSSRSARFLKGILLLLLCVQWLAFPQVAIAQTQPRTPAFVYAITAFDGEIYHSSFAPPSSGSIYLIADNENILSSRSTNIYFWPLTNRYEADWLLKNEFVGGTLEVLQGNRVIKTLTPVDYVVQYDSNDPVATRNLATGDKAAPAYADFKAKQMAYRDALSDYYKKQQAYRNEVDKLVKEATKAGKTLTDSDFPAQPKEVPPLTLFSTEVSKGFVISLPVGQYRVQLRLADGSIQPGSVKKLVTFAKLRDGISYSVMPQARWTKPDYSLSDGGVIYTPNGTVVYLQAYFQGQYNDYAYGHMLDPQDTTSRQDQARWISFGAVKAGSLAVVPSPSGQSLPMVGYKIIQSAGSGLGYEVRNLEADSTETPSFTGFQLDMHASNASYQIRLLDENGQEEPGSRREVRILYTSRAGWLYGLSVFPLLIGAGVFIARRRSVRKVKVEA